MREFALHVSDWLGDASPGGSTATVGSLRMTAGPPDRIVYLTDVEDTVARSVRSHINVSAQALAEWMLINWWRLRWEPLVPRRPPDWLQAHSLASIGEGYAWPAIEFSSDGDFVHIYLAPEATPDVAAVRYLRAVDLDVPAQDFEDALDDFFDLVEARIASRAVSRTSFSELRAELREERASPEVSRDCRLQALAGIDPGTAPEGWLDAITRLAAKAGAAASEEIVATLPLMKHGLNSATATLAAMRDSPAKVDISWVGGVRSSASPETDTRHERPWERGARVASMVRAFLSISPGPIANSVLEERLGVKLPLPATHSGDWALRGAARPPANGGKASILVTRPRHTSQRFDLARLIASAYALPDDPILPVSDADTSLQKYERAFAQEFLCPWADLQAYVEEHGTTDEGLTDAADHFAVSEYVVRSLLVNKGALSRDRFPHSAR